MHHGEAGTLLSQTLTNGYGQLVQQYQQTQEPAADEDEEVPEPIVMAPTLYEYDSFGNLTRQTLSLEEAPSSTEFTYTLESSDEGVFSCTTQTRYNAENLPLTSTQKQLISQMIATLEQKVITINERGLTSADWAVYNNGTKRTRYSTVLTSDITAETVTADGFALSQKDTAGIITTATRSYTAGGMVFTQTDGRGNTTTTVTDIAGRTLTVTDATGNVTTTAYDAAQDLPSESQDEKYLQI